MTQSPNRPGCGGCARIRNALPLPQRVRTALETFEQKRLRRKEAKRLHKVRSS